MGPRASITLRLTLVVTVAAFFLVCDLPGQAPSTTPPNKSSSSPAGALGLYVYPKNQQTQAQQQRDEAECFSWAKEQGGIDPLAPPASSAQPAPNKPKGGGLKGAGGGAAAGAAIGAVAGDAGKGAAVGATAGAIRGRRQQRRAEKQMEQQSKVNAQAAQQQKLENLRKPFSACMDARQYSVK